MTQFYIVEIQKYYNGEYGHTVHFVYDENADKARLKAESKYHEVLAAAAVSETAEHSAIMFSTEGFPLMHQCYKHEIPEEIPEDQTPEEQTPEEQTPEEPEPTVETEPEG